MSTFKNFYAMRLKKVPFEQLTKKKSRNQGGLNPPFQNSGGVATPPPPPLFGARVHTRACYKNHRPATIMVINLSLRFVDQIGTSVRFWPRKVKC